MCRRQLALLSFVENNDCGDTKFNRNEQHQVHGKGGKLVSRTLVITVFQLPNRPGRKQWLGGLRLEKGFFFFFFPELPPGE